MLPGPKTPDGEHMILHCDGNLGHVGLHKTNVWWETRLYVSKEEAEVDRA